MRVAVGQLWELPSKGVADPLVLRVVELLDEDRFAVVQTVRRSQPDVILDRSTMFWREVMAAGVLVGGPGADNERRRRERISEHVGLLLYEARKVHPPPAATDVRFGAHEVVSAVAETQGVDRNSARAMLRDALATLGGREIMNYYEPDYSWPKKSKSSVPGFHEVGYEIPIEAVRPVGTQSED
jgi:hypothetical protein